MNFDPVADRYDQTRGLPQGLPELIRDQIVHSAAATADTRFLEPGIGTGRIALPFIQAGYRYTGIDISQGMMARLRAKVGETPNHLELIEGDVTALPFPDDSFEVAIVVHLLHLVPEWKQALTEIQRVTVPGGWLAHSGNNHPPGQASEMIREEWYRFASSQGAEIRPRHNQLADIEAELTDRGCVNSQYVVAQWERTMQPDSVLESLRTRTWSQTWTVPDDILEKAHLHMVGWINEQYGDPSREIPVREEFVVTMALWPE